MVPIGMPCKSSHATAAAENSRFALHAAHASSYRCLERTAKLVVGCTLGLVERLSRVGCGMDGTGGGDGDGVRCNVERGVRFVLDCGDVCEIRRYW
jgi:hypothetical protein